MVSIYTMGGHWALGYPAVSLFTNVFETIQYVGKIMRKFAGRGLVRRRLLI
jgi:hypothetical protein